MKNDSPHPLAGCDHCLRRKASSVQLLDVAEAKRSLKCQAIDRHIVSQIIGGKAFGVFNRISFVWLNGEIKLDVIYRLANISDAEELKRLNDEFNGVG